MPSLDPPPQLTGWLEKNPSAWLVIPTLSLLLGQAGAAAPLAPARFSMLLLLLPLLLLFWRGRRAWGFLLMLAGGLFALGFIRHSQILHPTFPADHLRSIMTEGSQMYVEGVLYREPERLPQRSRWLVRAERIWHPTGAQAATGDLLLSIRHTRGDWHYADRIRFRVRLTVPRGSDNPGAFDYASFLARRQIYLTGFLESDEEVELLARRPSSPWSAIEHMRREIRRFMERHFSQDNGALMKALVVGDMGGISKEMRLDFTAAGVNHVLSISGLHVGMLGLVVFIAVRFLGSFSTTVLLRWNLLKIATFFSFLAVLFYTALAGAMVPTVRSAIMIGVYELAVLLDREEELLASLAFAALLIALAWPGVIMDISFQLSFLAVLFIIWGIRRVQEWLPVEGRDTLPQERSWIRARMRQVALYLSVPLLATAGTGPMIAYHFGHLSTAGFISNPVVVPLIGFVIVPLGLVIGFFALVAPALAVPLVWISESLLSLAYAVVRFFAQLPFASIAVPMPDFLEVGLLYVAILSLLVLRRGSWLLPVLGLVFIGLMADAVYWWRERGNRSDLRITHLSVGHGDATVVEFPGSKVLLIDAGGTATGEFDTGESIVAPFLRSRKILKVHYLLVSHPRADHYGGMRSIVEEFGPLEFWTGPSKGRTVRYEELEEALERAAVRRVLLSDADPCRSIEQVKLCVLYPSQEHGRDSSVVMRMAFGQVRLLFAGDIERRDERLLLQNGTELTSAVLKVPRHGSLASSTEEFVAAVRPKLAVFSVGQRNPFGLPRAEVVARYRAAGAEILRTDQDGAIIIETDGEKIRYRTYRSGKKGKIGL